MKKIIALILSCGIIASCITSSVTASSSVKVQNTENITEGSIGAVPSIVTGSNSIEALDDETLSSIAMLNYVTALTQEINASKNSRLYLDNAFSSIVNNIDPNKLDDDSLDEVLSILNTIQAYATIDKKRERVQYIYEQNQAQALKHSLGNPIGLLSAIQSRGVLGLVTSIVYMAVDSYDSYKNYSTEIEQKYMQDNWALDDQESDALAESREDAFAYMVRMSRKHHINKEFSLTEETVEDFVKWEQNDNLVRRIRFLKDNVETYQAYGKYWLVD